MQFCIQLYIDIGEVIPYLQANPDWLKTKSTNSLIFIVTIIKQLIKQTSSPQGYCLERNFKYITWFWCSKQIRCF